MVENARPWWRDPRFIIPSIIVPVIGAAIGLFPYLAPENVSDKLLVTLSIRDPRHAEAGGFERRIERTFEVANHQSEAAAARAIAQSLTNDLISSHNIFRAQRTPLHVRLHQEADGRIVILEPQNAGLTLAVSRFVDVVDLHDLMHKANERAPMVQSGLLEPVLPRSESVPDAALKAGVYRITVTGPGFTTHSTYLQLTENGELLTLSTARTIEEIEFPVEFNLKPKSSGRLRIAIHPCQVSAAATTTPRYQNINQAVQNALESALRLRGLAPIMVHEGQRVGFDLALSKGMPPTEGLVSADFVIDHCNCEWLE